MRTSHALVVVLVTGCNALADAEHDIVQRLVEVREHMHVRFAATNNIRTAIAYGDIERVKAEAQTVVDLDEPDILPQWKPYVENVRAAALQITKTEDTTAAAKQLAVLGWRCAQCHEAVPGAKTVFPKIPSPPADPKLVATMAGHQWATARMWEGLIGPSMERWNEGAAALAKAPLNIAAEADVPGHKLGIADDVARIRLFATRAMKAKTTFDRADTYGQLLATCSNCHHAIRDR